MPVISRGVPAFASSQIWPARDANDADYSSFWRGAIPSWLALDLSSVPAAKRGRVVVGWYNDPQTSPYDHSVPGEEAYNNLRDYTLQANPAASGGAAPTSGWVTLASVTGNTLHSRQHVVDLTGYNWLRLNVTGSDGSAGNDDAALNLDVHDASQGTGDSWLFFGDSITMDGLNHDRQGTTGNVSELVNAAKPSHFPAFENGGIGGVTSSQGAQKIDSWLSRFPGKYVGLAYGTNDANGCGDTAAFQSNYAKMIGAVLAAGKVPVVPTIPWARTSGVRSCAPGYNARIEALYATYPQVVKGPDLWKYFESNQSLISSDNLHPTPSGYAGLRQQWANAMLANVYSAPAGPPPTPAPSVSSFAPTSGAAGTNITLTGTSLTGATAVKLGSVAATFTVNSATSISTTVPSGGATGKWSVTTPGGTATSAGTFTVGGGSPPPPPPPPLRRHLLRLRLRLLRLLPLLLLLLLRRAGTRRLLPSRLGSRSRSRPGRASRSPGRRPRTTSVWSDTSSTATGSPLGRQPAGRTTCPASSAARPTTSASRPRTPWATSRRAPSSLPLPRSASARRRGGYPRRR